MSLFSRKVPGTQDMTPVVKGPFPFEASRPDQWNWPYSSTTECYSRGYQNYWWGNQLPNQEITVWNYGNAQNAGNHRLWAPAPQWQISQLPYGQWGNQLGMSQSTTASLLSKMSAAWQAMYSGGS